MIVAGPLIDASNRGRTSDGLVDSVDVWRTVANLMGITDREVDAYVETLASPPAVDSVSFLPLLIDPLGPSPRSTSYAEVFSPNSCGGRPFEPVTWLRMVTDGRYKLVRRVYDAVWEDGEMVAGTVAEEPLSPDRRPLGARPDLRAAPGPLAVRPGLPAAGVRGAVQPLLRRPGL